MSKFEQRTYKRYVYKQYNIYIIRIFIEWKEDKKRKASPTRLQREQQDIPIQLNTIHFRSKYIFRIAAHAEDERF